MSGATPSPEGLLVVDKPVGITSHDVVARVRRLLGERRVGHGGTLDPPASGVLLVAVGRGTRLLRYVLDLEKRYVGELVLGQATTTLDDTGEVTDEKDMSDVTFDEVRSAARSFVGEIDQIPPMVSAVKSKGRRLYELAREGIEVEREPRRVTVHSLEVLPGDAPSIFGLEVCCSSGTYVRTLAADIATALGGVGHLRRLRRSAIGPFDLSRAVTLEEVTRAQLLPRGELVGHLQQVAIDAELARRVATGAVFDRGSLPVAGAGPFAVSFDGELIAVYESSGDRLKPAVVLVEPPVSGAKEPGN